ncbi:hypothetical protein QTP88_019401 [Uroleucon formosanum]
MGESEQQLLDLLCNQRVFATCLPIILYLIFPKSDKSALSPPNLVADFTLTDSSNVSNNVITVSFNDIVENKSEIFMSSTIVNEVKPESGNSLEIQGRRFIDIGHLIKSIQRIRHEAFDCTFTNLDLVKEIHKGYFSKFIFKCKICCKMEGISLEPEEKSTALKINTAIVSSVVNTGQGYAQLELF